MECEKHLQIPLLQAELIRCLRTSLSAICTRDSMALVTDSLSRANCKTVAYSQQYKCKCPAITLYLSLTKWLPLATEEGSSQLLKPLVNKTPLAGGFHHIYQ